MDQWKKVKRSTYFRRKVNRIYLNLKSGSIKTVSIDKNAIINRNNPSTRPSVILSKVPNCTHQKCISSGGQENFLVSGVDPIYIENKIILSENLHDDVTSDDSECYPSDFLTNTELKRNEALGTELKMWAIQHNISHLALKGLLQICNNRNPGTLPKDPRTLLQSPMIITISPVGLSGQYWHQGLQFCLQQCFDNIEESVAISININIDGLPIYNSSKEEFWPILFNINRTVNFTTLKRRVIVQLCKFGFHTKH